MATAAAAGTAAPPPAAPYTVVGQGGKAKATDVDSKGFLEASPRWVLRRVRLICSMGSTCLSLIVFTRSTRTRHRGPYTTARTVAGSRVFELEAHIERLASTAALMWPDEQGTWVGVG